jgi:hypothetical protein
MATFDLVIFKELKSFLQTAALKPEKYTTRVQDFTRKRKLDFSTTFVFILSLLKKVCR